MLVSLEQQLKNADPKEIILPKSCLDEFIYSPFQGTVRRILFQINEFAKRGLPLAILEPENAPVRIEAFLDKKELQYLVIGNSVSITFPDGIQSTGLIKNIYSSAYAFPELEWNEYEPLDTRIRIHIIPANKDDAEMWRKYDLLRVRIRGEHE